MPAVAAPTVIVVDGEPLIRWSVGERLRDEGYDVLEAATGREAIEHCRNCVDLVLLDSRLPDLDGLSVLGHLLKTRPNLPVILMTADPATEPAAERRHLRPFPCARKPFLLDDVVGLVHASLRVGIFPRERENVRTI